MYTTQLIKRPLAKLLSRDSVRRSRCSTQRKKGQEVHLIIAQMQLQTTIKKITRNRLTDMKDGFCLPVDKNYCHMTLNKNNIDEVILITKSITIILHNNNMHSQLYNIQVFNYFIHYLYLKLNIYHIYICIILNMATSRNVFLRLIIKIFFLILKVNPNF